MLMLSRKINESLIIEGADGPIEIVVTELSSGQVRFGIKAPKTYKIFRKELSRTMEYNRQAAAASPSHLKDIAKQLQ